MQDPSFKAPAKKPATGMVIEDFLYHGGSKALKEVSDFEIAAVVNVSKDMDFPASIQESNRTRVAVDDVDTENIASHFDSVYDFLERQREAGNRVLVHCKMGLSRSSAIVIAYLMRRFGYSLDQATKFMQEHKRGVEMNPGFLSQLQTYEVQQKSVSAPNGDSATATAASKRIDKSDQKDRKSSMTAPTSTTATHVSSGGSGSEMPVLDRTGSAKMKRGPKAAASASNDGGLGAVVQHPATAAVKAASSTKSTSMELSS